MDEYLKRSQFFQNRLGVKAIPRREARYLLYRIACPLMQAKLPRLIDLNKVPKTFLHGNPHIDNYVRTFKGSAMVDFDRSRIGPYCWDIIRFLGSISLRREKMDGFLDRKVVDFFIDAYTTHFANPDLPYKQFKLLKNVPAASWQESTSSYLRANKKWAKKMRESSIGATNESALKLLRAFLENRNEMDLLNQYLVSEIGLTPGSLGKQHYIYSLIPKNPASKLDSIIFDIKEVYQEKDTKFFYSPTPHHGHRMIIASNLYAEGMEERIGYCTFEGKQYWGRQIPSFAVKVKKFLDLNEQCDFAYSVGSELARGHRLGLLDPEDAELVENDFRENFDKYYKVSRFLTYELALAYESMRRKIKLYKEFRSW